MEAAKFKILPNFLSPKIYQYIEESTSYKEALMTLEAAYVKPVNEIYARHILATRKQQPSETLTEYLQALRVLSKDCNFETVSAAQHRDESVRDAFITGLRSTTIRQRLLEFKSLDLDSMFYQAQSLESAASNSEGFSAPPTFNAAVPDCRRAEAPTTTDLPDTGAAAAAIPSKTSKCFFCGNIKHPRFKCPAREATCLKCRKQGHFARVCRGNAAAPAPSASAAMGYATLASVQPTNRPLSRSSAEVTVNGKSFEALFDSGSSESFIHPDVVQAAALKPFPAPRTVAMAESSISTPVKSACIIDLDYRGRKYKNVQVSVYCQTSAVA